MKLKFHNIFCLQNFIISSPLFLFFFGLTFVLFKPDQMGIFDWDTSLQRFEALYITVINFQQWPGLNPWIGGGQPLISNPGAFIFSIEGLFVLILGAFWGLRVSILFYYFLGLVGAWKLSRLFCQFKFLRIVFATYIISNAAFAFHLSVGHLVFLNFLLMPWLFLYVLQVENDIWSGLKAAFVFGMAFLSSPMYVIQYALLISVIIFFIRWWQASSLKKYCYIHWLILFIPTVATLTWYRVLTILFTATDYSRKSGWVTHFDFFSILKYFYYPFNSLEILKNVDGLGIGTWELSCFLGYTASFLCILSFRHGLRWFHITLCILIWADVGNDNWYYLMYWVQKLPYFDSHQTFMRVRMFIPIFVGIAALVELNFLSKRVQKLETINFKYFLVIILSVLMVAEVLVISYRILSLSHKPVPLDAEFNFTRNIVSISNLPRNKDLPPEVGTSYAATRSNLGWIKGSDSYIPAKNVRVGKDDAGYIGEYTQAGRAITPVYWSPNRILFEGLIIGTPLIINLNPGNPWHSNGIKIFPDYKITEPLKVFEVMPNDKGVIELNYIYPGRLIGGLGTLIFLVFAGYAVFITRRKPSWKFN